MTDPDHKNEDSTTSVGFWLPIGAGAGAAIGAALTTVTGPLGSFTGIATCLAFVGVGVALGMLLVAILAVSLHKR